jgi:small subunit ribosomal protein S12
MKVGRNAWRRQSNFEEGSEGFMPTINQLIRKGREPQKAKSKVPAMEQNPQKRGVCTRVYTTTRRSRTRRAQGGQGPPDQPARSDQLHSGEGHNLQEHSGGAASAAAVCATFRGVPLPRAARRARHQGVKNAQAVRSKYGAKRPK